MITKTFDEVFTFEALYRAHIRGRSGKRFKKPVVRFELNQTAHIWELYNSLRSGTYKPSRYHAFIVYEPKKREIQTLQYADRVVQHVLCDQILAPHFTRRSIMDNCVCQKGKGLHFALDRFEGMLHEFISRHGLNGYFLKCDILKYFPTIPHEQLKKTICSEILDNRLRDFVAAIIDSFHTAPEYLSRYGVKPMGAGVKTARGIPIGNQTSQIFGMYYLDPVDRLIKEQLRFKVYSRYMDDFIAVHEDREFLQKALKIIGDKVARLGLALNSKTQIFPLKNGVTYLGFRYRVTQTGGVVKVVKKASKRRLRSHVRLIKKAYLEGYITAPRVVNTVASVRGHLMHGQNTQFQREINRKLLPLIAKAGGLIFKRRKK